MGKASIISGGEDGSYTVKLDFGRAVKHQQLKGFDDLLAQLAPLITDAQTKLTQQEAAESAKRSAVTAATDAYTTAAQADPPDPAALKKALDAFTAALATLNSERARTSQLRLSLQMLKDEKAQIDKDYATWSAMELEATQQAWCADLTEDATGDVNIIEVPGESKLILLAPGAPAYTASTGALVAREVQSPEQVFWNAAVLPGWQKHKPTYRRGTITAINAESDTADVTLEATDVSSAQKLGINKTPTLANVPVVYMSCNAGAFAVGDRAVVKFYGQSWDTPKIVGFVDHPKPCGVRFALVPASFSATEQWGWTAPLALPDGTPINDGKGTMATADNSGSCAVYVPTRIVAGQATGEFIKGSLKRAQPSGNQGLLAYGGYDSYLTPGGYWWASPSLASGLHAINREWVSPDRSTCVTTAFGDVRVNGTSKGAPSDTVFWACIMHKTVPTPTNPVATVPYLVAWSFDAPHLTVHRRPLAGSDAAWVLVAAKSVLDYDSEAMDATWYTAQPAIREFDPKTSWARKSARNASGTVCSTWLQHPRYWRFVSLGRAGKWAWVLDYNINTGVLTDTAMPTETISQGGTYVYDTVVTSKVASQTEFYSQTGVRHIDFEYDGDVKTYTSLLFSGRYDFDLTGEMAGEAPHQFWSINKTYVGDLKIVLKRGTLEVAVFEGTYNGAYGADTAQAASVTELQSQLYHYGNGAICYSQKTLAVEASGLSSGISMTSAMTFLIPDEDVTLPLVPETTAVLSGFSTGEPNYQWHANTYSGPGGTETLGLSTLMSGALECRTHRPLTDIDRSLLNFRVVDGAWVLSMAKPTLEPSTGVISVDPTQYITHASDPDLMAALQVATPGGVLKHIKLI